MSILTNPARCGNFTSSEIHRLMTTPAKAKTYIEEKNIERRMGICLGTEVVTREMSWGNFLEQRVLDLLGTEYRPTPKITTQHPDVDHWAGSADLVVNGVKISEIKCYQRKNFALYTDAILEKNPEVLRLTCPEEYWQLVSNAIILGLPKAEAITYMPYESEIGDIRQMAIDYADIDQYKYRFIYESPIEALAYLPDGGYYKNLNVFEFDVPEKDKVALTNVVLAAGRLLTPKNK